MKTISRQSLNMRWQGVSENTYLEKVIAAISCIQKFDFFFRWRSAGG